MKISPYTRRFLNADAGGAVGAPVAPSAEPVAAPPAPSPTAPPAGGDAKPERTAAEKELDDFKPEEFHDGDEPPVAKPDPKAKPEDKKQAPAPKPEDKKPGELADNAPAAKIRERLKEVEKERDAWKQKAETPPPKLGELEGQLTELRAEKERLQKDIDETRQELAMHDPRSSKEIKDLEREYDAKFNRDARFMPELREAIGPLVQEFAALQGGDPKLYSEGLKEFRAKVAEVVGPENAAQALGLIAEGMDFIQRRDALEKDVKQNGATKHFGSQLDTWKKNVDLTSQHLAGALETVADFETVQPYHPINFVKRALETFDDTQKAGQKQWEDNADTYIKFAANGVSPEALAKLQNLPPKEREARMAKIESDRIEAAKWVRTHAKQAAFYNRFLPGILADYARLLEADKKRAAGQPPSPNEGKGGSPTEDFGDDIHKMGKVQVPDI